MGGRRRQKNYRQEGDSDDEAPVRVSTCKHIRSAVNVSAVRKCVSRGLTEVCVDCEKLKKEATAASPEVENEDEDATAAVTVAAGVWLCLQCAHRGCGRGSPLQHALKHHEKPRSDKHCLVLALHTFELWCYECDEEVFTDQNRPLKEVLNVVKKQLHSEAAPSGEVSLAAASTSSPVAFEENMDTVVGKKSKRVSNGVGHAGIDNSHSVGGVRGLNNLGNTCFFNSAMQCLASTRGLGEYLQVVAKGADKTELHLAGNHPGWEVSDITPQCPDLRLQLPVDGVLSLTAELSKLLISMRAGSRPDPSKVFGTVAAKRVQFRGFRQQDSHELLRTLLDMVKQEEVRRGQQALLTKFNCVSKNHEKLSDEEKATVKFYGRRVKETTCVDQVFGGYLLSSVTCQTCKAPSQMFEPFLDLSLPVHEENQSRQSSSASGPSKYQMKKQKKMNKKERRKQTRLLQSTSVSSSEPSAEAEPETEDTEEKRDSEKSASDAEVDGEADVEDNLDASVLTTGVSSLDVDDKLEEIHRRALLPLAASVSSERGGATLESCLAQFTQPELLTGANRVYCERCKLRRDACKQYLLVRAPPILTLQLKRFQQVGFGEPQKVNRSVAFPLELDLAPFCSSLLPRLDHLQCSQVRYKLFGLVEHSGRLHGGHYTAFVRVTQHSTDATALADLVSLRSRLPRPPHRRPYLCDMEVMDQSQLEEEEEPTCTAAETSDISEWYHISDSMVRKVTEQQVLKAQAYILFYERIV